MLIINGVKYKPWTPKDEEAEFHPMVKANSKNIFGEDSFYFDVKTLLKSGSGIGSIPDAYVLNFSGPGTWYVIENELASHPVFDHVVKQLGKFINGIENQNSRNQIADLLYEQICSDPVLEATIRKLTKTKDVYHLLSKLFSADPRIVIVIDEKTAEIEEAVRVLKYDTSIVEFKTFVREGSENVRVHLFDPLFSRVLVSPRKTFQTSKALPYERKGYTGKIAKAFVFNGMRHPVNSWKEILLIVCAEISKLHHKDFDRILSLKGRKKPYFSKNSEELRSFEEIEGISIFAETNLSSNAIARLSREVAKLFGYDNNLQIEIE